MLDLAVDDRWSKRLHRPPPYSRLAVPSPLARLSAGSEPRKDLFEMARAGYTHDTNRNDRGDVELAFFGNSIDLTDGFYQFKCDGLATLFGLGSQATVTEMEKMFAVTLSTACTMTRRQGRYRYRKVIFWSAASLPCPSQERPGQSNQILRRAASASWCWDRRGQRGLRPLCWLRAAEETSLWSKDKFPAVPARILNPGRWRLIVAGAWNEASRINLFEARAALLGLRRACAQRTLRGKIVVSLGDNLSEILSIERGRATNRALNAPCRQFLAWQ